MRTGVRSKVAPTRKGWLITELTSVKPDGILFEDGMATPRGRKKANFRPAL